MSGSIRLCIDIFVSISSFSILNYVTETSISVHVRVILVDIIKLAVGIPGLPEGTVISNTNGG